jgi:hypothetical protein
LPWIACEIRKPQSFPAANRGNPLAFDIAYKKSMEEDLADLGKAEARRMDKRNAEMILWF